MNKKDQFLKFSKNLEFVLSSFNPKIELITKHENGNYICPIGFTNHSIDCLENTSSNQLTIEHAPPKSVDGKPTCLVRKDINNKSGYLNDKALINYFESLQFNRKEKPIIAKMFLDLPRLKTPKIKFFVDSNDQLNFVFDKIRLDEHFTNESFKEDYSFKFEFSLQNLTQTVKNLFLKIAYLHAFKCIGYILLFGPKNVINPVPKSKKSNSQ